MNDYDEFHMLVFLNWTQREADAGFARAIDAYVADVSGGDEDLAWQARHHATELFAEIDEY